MLLEIYCMIDFLNQKKESDEVYCSSQDITTLEKKDIHELIRLAEQTNRNRARFCSHGDPSMPVHEMFIVHPQSAYVRPHKHNGKSESMMVLAGEVDYVVFDEIGNIKDVTSMGNYNSGKPFYKSIDAGCYHSLLIRSEWLVFFEVTKGPFDRNDTVFGEWSPDEVDADGALEYIKKINDEIR